MHTCGWDFILVEHSPKINRWSLPVRAAVPVSVKISGFVLNSRSIRVCEWFVMRVGTDIGCLRLLFLVIYSSQSVSVECVSKLRLKSPINMTFFHSDTALSSVNSRLSSTDEVALGGLYIFPSRRILWFIRTSSQRISTPSSSRSFLLLL